MALAYYRGNAIFLFLILNNVNSKHTLDPCIYCRDL